MMRLGAFAAAMAASANAQGGDYGMGGGSYGAGSPSYSSGSMGSGGQASAVAHVYDKCAPSKGDLPLRMSGCTALPGTALYFSVRE